MITEWSAFYGRSPIPETSKLGDCLAVAPEPAGPAGRLPALGGFSLAVAVAGARRRSRRRRWIFIQWATSEDIARAYVEAGGVSGRTAIYEQPDIKAKYKFVEPMVASWQKGVPDFRPRFPAWPAISEDRRGVGLQDDARRGHHRGRRQADRGHDGRRSSRRKATTTAKPLLQ